MGVEELFDKFCQEFHKEDSIYKRKHIHRIKEAFLREKATIIFDDNRFSFAEDLNIYERKNIYESCSTGLRLNIDDYTTVEHFLKQKNNFDFYHSYEDYFDLEFYWQDIESFCKRNFLREEERFDLLAYADGEYMPQEFFDFKEELYQRPLKSLFTKEELKNHKQDYWRAFRDFSYEIYNSPKRKNLTLSMISFETNGSLLLQRSSQYNRFNWQVIPQSLCMILARQLLDKEISVIIREKSPFNMEGYPVYRISSLVFNSQGVRYLSREEVSLVYRDKYPSEIFFDAKAHMPMLGVESLRGVVEFI